MDAQGKGLLRVRGNLGIESVFLVHLHLHVGNYMQLKPDGSGYFVSPEYREIWSHDCGLHVSNRGCDGRCPVQEKS